MKLTRLDRVLIPAFWITALVFVISFWVAIWALMAMALAHDAEPTAAQPQGWSYATSCCSSYDCQHIVTEAVRITPNGYVLSLGPKTHHMLVKDEQWTVDYGSPKIKESPDGRYHACVTRQTIFEGGNQSGGNLICLYVPPMSY